MAMNPSMKMNGPAYFNRTTARHILDAARAASQQAPSQGIATAHGVATRPVPVPDVFLCMITDVGPASEPDYTGPQYWVQSAIITNSIGSNPPNTTLPTIAIGTTGVESSIWLTATNLAEVESGSHALPVGTIVQVEELYGLDQSPYYVFSAGGTGGAPTITITIDGQGSAIVSGGLDGATVFIPSATSIKSWVVEADASGSIVVDILRANAGVPSSSIVGGGGNPPTLSSAQYAGPTTVSGWTSTALAANDVIGFSVTSAATVKRVTVTLILG